MQAWKDYQEKNKDRFLNELLELLRIPSVSARSEHGPDMVACAEAVKQRLLEAGVDKAEIHPTAGHPIVYAEKIVDPIQTNRAGVRPLRCAARRSFRALEQRPL